MGRGESDLDALLGVGVAPGRDAETEREFNEIVDEFASAPDSASFDGARALVRGVEARAARLARALYHWLLNEAASQLGATKADDGTEEAALTPILRAQLIQTGSEAAWAGVKEDETRPRSFPGALLERASQITPTRVWRELWDRDESGAALGYVGVWCLAGEMSESMREGARAPSSAAWEMFTRSLDPLSRSALAQVLRAQGLSGPSRMQLASTGRRLGIGDSEWVLRRTARAQSEITEKMVDRAAEVLRTEVRSPERLPGLAREVRGQVIEISRELTLDFLAESVAHKASRESWPFHGASERELAALEEICSDRALVGEMITEAITAENEAPAQSNAEEELARALRDRVQTELSALGPSE